MPLFLKNVLHIAIVMYLRDTDKKKKKKKKIEVLQNRSRTYELPILLARMATNLKVTGTPL